MRAGGDGVAAESRNESASRGRTPGHAGVRPSWVAVIAGVVAVLGALAGWVAAPNRAAMAIGPVVALTGLGVTVWDVCTRRVPESLLVVGTGAVAAVGIAVAVLDHRNVVLGVLAGAALAGGVLLMVHLFTPRGLGFGDVRYGFVLGGSVGV